MKLLKKHNEIRNYYKDKDISQKYINIRFENTLGCVLHEKQVKTINQLIDEYRTRRILELACGPGRLTCDITGGNYRVAVDGSPNMIKEARGSMVERRLKKQWHLCVADIFDLNLNKKFDLIYTFRFIRHFDLPDRQKIYRKIRQHLKPGGYIVFDVINKKVSEPVRQKGGLDKYNIYDKLYYENEFRKEMSAQGWKINQLIPTHPHYEWLRKLQIYLAPRNRSLAYYFMSWMENNLNNKPLEWIAICQCE